jgi:(+)-trans-carveol dehydrogenase
MATLDGTVVFISGVARGQGRAHAQRFSAEGARVIGFDICANIDTVPFEMGTKEDLDETVRLVQAAGGQIVAVQGDVRDYGQVEKALQAGLTEFGRVDAVIANAGIGQPYEPAWQMSEEAFRNVIDVNLIGVWHTAKAAVTHMVDNDRSGSIVFTGSGASLKGIRHMAGYVAAKHGLIGLMRTMARELADRHIRVNAVLPGNTNTPMFHNEGLRKLFVPNIAEPTEQQFVERITAAMPMRVPWVEASDIAEATLWLSSPAARYITGVALSIDAGSGIP